MYLLYIYSCSISFNRLNPLLQLILLEYLKIPILLHVSCSWVRILFATSIQIIYKTVTKTEPHENLPLAVYNFMY